ncbi:MAG TPA: ArsR family transcriptional regulator [Thermoplasmatales archaeon]|nr:ArsR family transcriptional regulator [Thermoplasmatales archaeon]
MKVEIPPEIEKELERKGGLEVIEKSIPDLKKIEGMIKAISDEKRLKILYGLYRQRMCVCMLAKIIDCPYSKCSYHISILKEIGLIDGKSLGNYIIYSLTPLGRKILKVIEKIKEMMK